jgi:hypothetical protein
MAGMATRAPIGTAAAPASTRAANQGSPRPDDEAKWEKAVAPTAPKAAWHSEI